jgi:hypothetical protein
MLLITDGLPRGLGYVEVDNRPAGQGYFEADTYTCSHCETVVILNPARKRERYKCNGCSHHICDDCAAKAVMGEKCYPYKKMVEDQLEQASRQSSSSLILP